MLSTAEVNERKRQGLCFHCDERCANGHVCKTKLYMLHGEESNEIQEVVELVEQDELEISAMGGEDCHISVDAWTGVVAHNTIKVKGLVNKQVLTILIDSGATHNFIDPSTVEQLGYVEELTNPVSVTVSDGNKLVSGSKCSKFKWLMRGNQFEAGLRILSWWM